MHKQKREQTTIAVNGGRRINVANLFYHVSNNYFRHLYISESGKDPKILRADLDGQNLAVIKKTGSPSGLAIFEDTVTFFDSYHGYNSSGGDIAIDTYNTVDGSFENIGAENVV